MNELIHQHYATPDYAAPQASGLRNPEQWFFDALGDTPSDSGERVNARTALGHVPVWQAINILAGDLGQLPFHKMIRDGENIGKDREHQLEFLLTQQPNPWQTPAQWKETMMHWALSWGNAVCWKRRFGGSIVLWPLHPQHTSYEEPNPGEFIITSKIDGKPIVLRYEEVFHIRGLSDDGFWGMSAVSVLKNAIGHGLALQKHGNNVFKNGGRPSGSVSFPESVSPSPEASQNFRDEWKKVHRYSGEIAVLWQGGQYTPISMSNEDAQWLDGRKLDRQFIASVFNIPAFKLNGDESSATRSNMEEQQRSYYMTSLSRWTNKFKEEAERKLLSVKERHSGLHFFRWFPEAFLRGDLKSRSEAYGFAIRDRWLSPNEVREKEDLNPYDGGDDYLNPAIDPRNSQQPKPQEAVENLIKHQVGQLLATESNRIERASKTARNFTNWTTDFYSRFEELAATYLAPACELAKHMGIATDWKQATTTHGQQSLSSLLLIVDSVSKRELVDAAARFTEQNRRAIDNYLDSIMEAEHAA